MKYWKVTLLTGHQSRTLQLIVIVVLTREEIIREFFLLLVGPHVSIEVYSCLPKGGVQLNPLTPPDLPLLVRDSSSKVGKGITSDVMITL